MFWVLGEILGFNVLVSLENGGMESKVMAQGELQNSSERGLEYTCSHICISTVLPKCCHVLGIQRKYLNSEKKKEGKFGDNRILCLICRKLEGQSIIKYS